MIIQKLEIRLDEDKIHEEGKYAPGHLNQTLIKAFEKEQLDYRSELDGTLVFAGRGQAKDYGCFGKLNYGTSETTLVYGVCRTVGMVQQR